MKYYYLIDNSGKLWGGHCGIVDAEKYDKLYSVYLTTAISVLNMEEVERELQEIEKIMTGKKEYYDSVSVFFEYFIYKDRIDFFVLFKMIMKIVDVHWMNIRKR